MAKVIENIFNSLTTPEQRKQIKENIDNSRQFISDRMSDFGNVIKTLGNINLGTMSVNDAIDYVSGIMSGDSEKLSDVALDLAIQAGLLAAFSGKMPASVKNIIPKIKSALPNKSVSGVKQLFKDMSEGKVTGEVKSFVDKYKPNFVLQGKPETNVFSSKLSKDELMDAAFNKEIAQASRKAGGREALHRQGLYKELPSVYNQKLPIVYKEGNVQIPNEIDKILWRNGTSFKQLADELGVKSKKDIPKLFKFVDELGKIIKNSPKFIRGMFDQSKGIYGILGNTGLSLVDMWLAFNEDGTLMPDTLASNAARLGASAIPGSPLLRVIYGSLGYFAGDALSQAALQKLFPNYLTSEQREEIRQGIYHPGIENQIDEYLVGNSGRRYHVKDGRIYAYDTGRPVNIQEALNDVSTGYQIQGDKNLADAKQKEQYANDLKNAKAAGYNIPDEQIAQAEAEVQQAYETLNNLPRYPQIIDYDPSGDLVEQYQQKEVVPTQQQQAQQMQQQQYQDQIDYEKAFNTIAQNTFNDLTKYVTDDALMAKYWQYMGQANAGQAVALTPEEFKSMYMMDYMQQAAPKIAQQAAYTLNILRQAQADKATNTYNFIKLAHDTNKNYATLAKDYYKINTDINQKMLENAIKQQEAKIKAIQANTAIRQQNTREQQLKINQQNANTAEKQVERLENLTPYQQAAYMGEMFGNMGNAASFGGISIDTMLQSNPELFQSVVPAAFGQPGVNAPQTNGNNSNTQNLNTNQTLNQNQSMINNIKGMQQ